MNSSGLWQGSKVALPGAYFGNSGPWAENLIFGVKHSWTWVWDPLFTSPVMLAKSVNVLIRDLMVTPLPSLCSLRDTVVFLASDFPWHVAPPSKASKWTIFHKAFQTFFKSSPEDEFIDLREADRQTSIGCLPHTLRPGIEPATFWYKGRCVKELSLLARAVLNFYVHISATVFASSDRKD